MSNFFLGWHYKNKYKGDKNKEEILVKKGIHQILRTKIAKWSSSKNDLK